jgi:hypothetical protein
MTITGSSSTFALQAPEADRAATRLEMQRKLQAMSDVMVKEKGLLNHAQTALLLDVSTKRVGELVRLGKLSRFDFLGRTYVSMREVQERYKLDLKAGRPPRSVAGRAVASVKAALKTDKVQAKLGGYAGPHVKAEHEAAKKRQKGQFRRKWREIQGGAKK